MKSGFPLPAISMCTDKTHEESAVPFTTKPLPAAFGHEVIGLDAEAPIPAETARALYDQWLYSGILLFRGVGTSPEALVNLSRCFGDLEVHPIPTFRMEGYPELIELTNKNGPIGPVYSFDGVPTYGRIPWHTDLAFKTTPNAGALLRMVQKTPTGGQTGWLDTALAYDELDPALQERIATLEARYEFCADLSGMRFNNPNGIRVGSGNPKYPDFPPVANPLVWVHPVTGRKLLNISTINLQNIIGMENAEGDALLQALVDHTTQAKYTYIHDWAENDIMLWDNRRTMHCAMGHPLDEIRIVQRSTVKGTVAMGRIIEEAQAA